MGFEPVIRARGARGVCLGDACDRGDALPLGLDGEVGTSA